METDEQMHANRQTVGKLDIQRQRQDLPRVFFDRFTHFGELNAMFQSFGKTDATFRKNCIFVSSIRSYSLTDTTSIAPQGMAKAKVNDCSFFSVCGVT